MRALVCHKITDDLSGVEVRDVDRPTPGDGDVLIKVHATSINFPDILLCQGKYQLKLEPPFVDLSRSAWESLCQLKNWRRTHCQMP